ncbi:MAG: gamma-glutamyl-gamma-aminobutyrate hydrolase family protein [Acidimicrobiales bacterium]
MSRPATRPLIGVTSYRQETRWWTWDRDAAVVPGAYLDMVVAAGGWPVLIPPVGDGATGPDAESAAAVVDSVAEPLLDALDGLIVIGGGDVSARRYGQDPDPRNGGVSDRRDELELQLLAAALDRDLPLLAVCRGHQVLNVVLGGSLIQQLPDVLGSTVHQPQAGAFGEVTVRTEPGTHVHRLLGDELEVQCSHHQAIDALGESLLVAARSPDGVVEAVEVLGRTFAVGVQWHPEENGDVRLFAGLVDAARSTGTRSIDRPTAEERL